MKGFISKVVAVLGFTGTLVSMGGCDHYRDIVDPCYPERYWHQSRQNVHAAFAPQVKNGHALDQTIWNYHFEDGSDKLTTGGQERLKYVARRRPAPDPMIFVQTAQDVAYNADKPNEYTMKKNDLDVKRVASVKKFLQAAGGDVVPFEVLVHNPPEVGMPGVMAEPSLRQMYTTPRATLPGQGGSTSGGGGGGGGGSGR